MTMSMKPPIKPRVRRLPRRAGGFSLVEILVTVVLALLLLVGVARVFLNAKQGYRVQESTSRLQENIRLTVDYFSRTIRLADFWGGVKARDLTILGGTDYTGPGLCSNSWIVDPGSGIVGFQGGAAAPALLPTDCLNGYVPNSDVLALRYANPDVYVTTAALTAGGTALAVNGKFYVRSRVGQRGVLFDATSQGANAVAAIPDNGDIGVQNYQYQTVVFYLQMNDFGRGPVPTLAMLKLRSDRLVSEQLVDGIEMLSFEYGLDTDGNRLVDRYRLAGGVSDWSQVMTVRASFIARGDELDSFSDTQQYPLAGDRCYGPPSSNCALKYSAADARYQRRLVVKEIQLRNRVRG